MKGRSKKVLAIGMILLMVFVIFAALPVNTGAEKEEKRNWVTDGNYVGTNDKFGSLNEEDLMFITNGEDRMVITSDGKVGIGITNPIYDLDVAGDLRVSGEIFIGSESTPWLEITDDGKVGIGTTEPEYELDVVGDIHSSGVIIASGISSNSPLIFYTNPGNIERARIDDITGNFGIGTDNPGAKLDVVVDLYEGGAATIGSSSNSATGDFSIAMGEEATAIGDHSIAMGRETIASNSESTAMGSHTTASGRASTAMGQSTTASGWASTAMGQDIIAAGDYSFGIGLDSKSPRWEITQDNTMAIMGGKIGIGTTSPGAKLQVQSDPISGPGPISSSGTNVYCDEEDFHFNSILTIGSEIIAAGETKEVITIPDDELLIVDSAWSTDLTDASFEYTDPSFIVAGTGDIGIGTMNPGAKFHIETLRGLEGGLLNIGDGNVATGDDAIAIGSGAYATSSRSIAIGSGVKADGYLSTAMGYRIDVKGSYSFGIGLGSFLYRPTITQSRTMAIMGGKVGIGTVSPDYKLSIGDGTNKRIHFSGWTYPNANRPSGSVVIYFDGTDLKAKNSSGSIRTIADF
jgi:hypothetical protein